MAAPAWEVHLLHPFTPAPLLSTMRLQVLRKPFAMFAAVVCALAVFKTRMTLARYAILPNTGLFAIASARSIDRNFLRNHAQKRATGFKSGLRAGIDHNVTLALACSR